jgi:triosephosphate isomerase
MSQGQRRPLVAGNWKMNGLSGSAAELDRMIDAAAGLSTRIDLLVCPPATLVATFAARARGTRVAVGAQDCHAEPSGAFTGDISAEMLADAGAAAVIVGHSERRAFHRESDAEVNAKAEAAWRAGLTAIVCIGETKDERAAGRTLDVVGRQLDGSVPNGATAKMLVVAYEPVWAIGTGLTPTPADVAEVHGFIRKRLAARFGAAGEGIRVKALQCGGPHGRHRCRRRAGGWREPQGRGLPRDRARVSLGRGRPGSRQRGEGLFVRAVLVPDRIGRIRAEVTGAAALALAERAQSLHVAQFGGRRMREFARAEPEGGQAAVEQVGGIRAVPRQGPQVIGRNADILRHPRHLGRRKCREIVEVLADRRMPAPPFGERSDDVLDNGPVLGLDGLGLDGLGLHGTLLLELEAR